MSGRVLDSNSSWLARELLKIGMETGIQMSAADDAASIEEALACVRQKGLGLVVISGGLGPTRDDLTASALSQAFGTQLQENPSARKMVAKASGVSPESLAPHQLKMAMLPVDAMPIRPEGKAPGFVIEVEGTTVLVLPGVPHELHRMWHKVLEDGLLDLAQEAGARKSLISVCLYGASEPEVNNEIDAFLQALPDQAQSDALDIGICYSLGEITIDIAFRQSARDAALHVESFLRKRFAEYIFSAGESVEEVVAGRMIETEGTVAVAESCTGGLLGAAITALSGSSAFFKGGVVSYHDDAKREILGVEADALSRWGAVSEQVARRMASRARTLFEADYGIGITGIAGPGGGTPAKPIGLVYVAVSSVSGERVDRFEFPGEREDVRRASVVASLHMLLREIP